MTKNELKQFVVNRGVSEVCSGKDIADCFGISIYTVRLAVKKGELNRAERNTYFLNSVLEWIVKNPRYIKAILNQAKEVVAK